MKEIFECVFGITGDAFQKKYYDAIQRDPAVVIDHAELARLFNNEPPESATP